MLTMEPQTYCSICRRPILAGQLVTGHTGFADGGDHVECHQSENKEQLTCGTHLCDSPAGLVAAHEDIVANVDLANSFNFTAKHVAATSPNRSSTQ